MYGAMSCTVCNAMCRSAAGVTSRCGDGRTDAANGEACDDGGTTSGNGCSATCTVEPGYACTGTPSTCAVVCGDGIRTAPETCDDGFTQAGDGCSATCTEEAGWSCDGADPTVCDPVCGDGSVLLYDFAAHSRVNLFGFDSIGDARSSPPLHFLRKSLLAHQVQLAQLAAAPRTLTPASSPPTTPRTGTPSTPDNKKKGSRIVKPATAATPTTAATATPTATTTTTTTKDNEDDDDESSSSIGEIG